MEKARTEAALQAAIEVQEIHSQRKREKKEKKKSKELDNPVDITDEQIEIGKAKEVAAQFAAKQLAKIQNKRKIEKMEKRAIQNATHMEKGIFCHNINGE